MYAGRGLGGDLTAIFGKNRPQTCQAAVKAQPRPGQNAFKPLARLTCATALVVHYQGLALHAAPALGHRAAQHVAAAACGNRHDVADGFGGVGLGMVKGRCLAWQEQKRRGLSRVRSCIVPRCR